MEKGAFAILDCLGFKGIWNRFDPQEILAKLIETDEVVQKACLPISLRFPSIDENAIVVDARLLSDTLVLSVKFRESNSNIEELAHHLVRFMCDLIGKVNNYFIKNKPNLILRGSVTFGEHLIQKNFIIGPAVDKAAEYEKLPNGAFIWLDPTAELLYKHNISWNLAEMDREYKELLHIVDDDCSLEQRKRRASLKARLATGHLPVIIDGYDMPLKDGNRLICSLFNPLYRDSMPINRRKIIDIYEEAMSDERIDVIIKRQNTLRFLQHCENITEAYLSKLVTNLEEYGRLAQLQ